MASIIDDELKERLLSSIAGDSLILLCGAGLSMAAPSNVSSAWHVAQHCSQAFRDNTGNDLPESMQNDIEEMAEHFYGRDELKNVFLRQLIDWREFVSRPENVGHLAVADFLGANVVDLAVSTNVDMLIEQAAKHLGEEDFYPVVLENELNLDNSTHAPLLKIHGCANRSRYDTVWCKSQLENEPLKTRIEQLAAWLRGRLPNRDLLVIGFWTDWSYLNAILEAAVVSTEPRSVIVIDPSTKAKLKEKSPALSKWAIKNTRFQHVRASGDEFLDELRRVVSCHFITKVWDKGREDYSSVFQTDPPVIPTIDLNEFSSQQLYAIRRNLTGVPCISIVRHVLADNSHSLIGLLYLGILLNGGELSEFGLKWRGDLLRLLHTPNESLSRVRSRFSCEPPSPINASRTICVGAWDDGGVPQRIIERGVEQGIIRNKPSDVWEPHANLIAELQEGSPT